MNKSYGYAQLVESYRRKEDGLPAHRVVANLGQLSDLEIDNLRTAINASRDNQKIVVAKLTKRSDLKINKPQLNLVYLDLAVLYEVWNQSGIGDVLREALVPSNTTVAVDIIIAVLCLHRCQDPGSKLSSTRWYKTTALPEITGVQVASFNNSRLHRALYELEQANAALMAKLPKLYSDCESDSSALFLDISDATFCGAGPPSFAQKGLSKDGAIRTKIGIVLLCNKDGLPLRWDVVAGANQDGATMVEVLDDVKSLSWIKGIPLVCDRAMGRTSLIQKMYEMGIMFLTALSRHEYTNYAGCLLDSAIDFDYAGLSDDEICEKAHRIISKRKGFFKVRDDLFTTDLGAIKVAVLSERSDLMRHKKYAGNRIRTAMDLGQRIRKLVTDSIFGSIVAAGKSLGIKPSLTCKYHKLTRLPEQVQQAILNGEADNCSINTIDEIAASGDPSTMFEAFYRHVEECKRKPVKPRREYHQFTDSNSEPNHASDFKVRVVAYFNPQMFANQKTRAIHWLQKIKEFEDDLNRRLGASNSRRDKGSIYAEIDRFIRKKDLIRCFDIEIHEVQQNNRMQQKVSIKLREKEWRARSAYDGFCVLVAHANCELSDQELCKLYRAKDVVEKDFQTIKSVLQVHPVRHRSDEKVKAHVSICMLSLLLERLLKKRLDSVSSTQEALETLHPCHLNRYEIDKNALYTITDLDTDQQRILKKLGLSHLADDDYLLERFNPR